MDSFISLFSAGSPIKPILDHVCCKILFFVFSLFICACDSLWIIFFFSSCLFWSALCNRRRRKWKATPVFLPGESQAWGSLVRCHLWGRTESDTTEATQQQQQQQQQQQCNRNCLHLLKCSLFAFSNTVALNMHDYGALEMLLVQQKSIIFS